MAEKTHSDTDVSKYQAPLWRCPLRPLAAAAADAMADRQNLKLCTHQNEVEQSEKFLAAEVDVTQTGVIGKSLKNDQEQPEHSAILCDVDASTRNYQGKANGVIPPFDRILPASNGSMGIDTGKGGSLSERGPIKHRQHQYQHQHQQQKYHRNEHQVHDIVRASSTSPDCSNLASPTPSTQSPMLALGSLLLTDPCASEDSGLHASPDTHQQKCQAAEALQKFVQPSMQNVQERASLAWIQENKVEKSMDITGDANNYENNRSSEQLCSSDSATTSTCCSDDESDDNAGDSGEDEDEISSTDASDSDSDSD